MKEILLAVDFSAATEAALQATLEVAVAFGSQVRLLHVAPPDPAFAHSRSWPQEVRDELAKELKSEHQQLRGYAQRLEDVGVSAKAFLARGAIADTILDYLRETRCDLLVVGANHEGALAQYLPQSVIRGLLKHASCPVLVVPARPRPTSE